MTWQLFSVLPVWVASLAAAIVIALVAPDQSITWIAITFAVAVIATFAIQLAIQRKEGFVVRAMASIGGSLIVLAVATGIHALL